MIPPISLSAGLKNFKKCMLFGVSPALRTILYRFYVVMTMDDIDVINAFVGHFREQKELIYCSL